MSTRVLTLFGEEIVPEPQKPAGKARAKKSEDTVPENATEQPKEKDEPEALLPAPVRESALVAEEEKKPDVTPENTAKLPKESDEPNAAIPALVQETAAIVDEKKEHDATPENTAEQPKGKDEPNTAIPAPVPETAAVTEEKKKPVKNPKEVTEDNVDTSEPADIIPDDWSGDKQYYTIGEVAGFFKVKTSHIRFWTNEFKLKVRTTRKGDRLFTPEQVKELRAIYHLVKERGFTLSGAKTKLKAQNKRDVVTVDLKTSLLQLKDKLVILRDQLV